MSTRRYPRGDMNLLYGLAAGRCSFPDCRAMCIERPTDEGDPAAMIGQVAHIAAKSNNGPRAIPTLSEKERDSYANWILLCGRHHPLVDRQWLKFGLNELHTWKKEHETWIYHQLQAGSLKAGFAELDILAKALRYFDPTDSMQTEPLRAPDLRAKLDHNALGVAARQHLMTGLTMSNVVQMYVRQYSEIDPLFPRRLVSGFKNYYNELYDDGIRGDALFINICTIASGASHDFVVQATGVAVVTYLFQLCEIFDEPAA
jgi:hypothetical protein